MTRVISRYGKKMNVGFVLTNYNNTKFTYGAVQSLSESVWSKSYSIVIIDNDSDSENIELLKKLKEKFPQVIIIYNETNIGYFKGLNIGIEYLKNAKTVIDYIVVGNNDLVFPNDFYENLLESTDNLNKYAVISPDIITIDGVHQNPHVRHGISKLREGVWDLYYSNYLLALTIGWFAKITHRYTKRKDFTSHMQAGVIYHGYGACYILTPVFFDNFKKLWAPTFLMGEEFFLWKQLNDKELEIFYEPRITVVHHDHATISKLPSKKLWEFSRVSYSLFKKYKL